MNKRAIELAAGFIVVLIISIVIFGLASALTYKIFCASENKIEQLNADSQKRVEQLLNSGASVNIPDATKTVKGTASFCGKSNVPSADFLLGIRNDFTTSQQFDISCTYNGMLGEDDKILPTNMDFDSCDDWKWSITSDSITVGEKDKGTRLLVFNVVPQAKAGKHIFTISVKYVDIDGNTQLYGAKKIYLTVE